MKSTNRADHVQEPPLVHISAGPFLMGSSERQIDALAREDDLARDWRDKGYFDREQPQHTLTLAGFFIGMLPVLVGEYRTAVLSPGATSSNRRAAIHG